MQNPGIHYVMVTFCVFACLDTHTHSSMYICIYAGLQQYTESHFVKMW